MRPDDKKKNNHYGVLCGLRASALGDSDPGSSRSSTPEPPPKDGKYPLAIPVNQRRPQSLTLPFDSRDRESRLVSEEDFDRILRQSELESDVPAILADRARNNPAAGLRRSISTARDTAFLRQRPVSLDVGSLVTHPVQGRGSKRPGSFSRDSTLTALPRPPTTNQMAVYPGQSPPSTPQQHQQSSPLNTRERHMRNVTISSDANNDNVFRDLFHQGHKRNRSAALMVETVKKRLKRSNNSPSLDAEKANISPTKITSGSPLQELSSYAASVQYQYGQPTSDTPPILESFVENATASAKPTIIASSNLKKSLLTRTWSRTKQHAKKFSISSPASNDSRPSISDPISLDIRPETAQSSRTETSTAASTGTSRYYASAEPSPRGTYESSRAGTPTSQRQDQDFECISGPTPKKNLLTRMGAPPRRSELNTAVARQQSRIVDLTLLNNVLIQQVETLRDEVEGMKVISHRNQYSFNNASPAHMARYQPSDGDSGHKFTGPSYHDSEQEDYSRIEGKRKSEGTASAWSSSVSARRRISSGRVQKDPEGWKHIMGVGADDGERMSIDGVEDDKRKTWMTCDSES